MVIKLELSPALYNNLRVLVIAGVKAPASDDVTIMAAAQLLQIMASAAQDASQIKASEPELPLGRDGNNGAGDGANVGALRAH